MSFAEILPLLAALTYVAGALWLKRAGDLGANVWWITCVCNWFSAIAFLPVLLLGGNAMSWTELWQPALVALLFLLGQSLAFLALRIGDVSIATPVLGIKIVLVAFFTTLLLGERVSGPLWLAAALSSVAIALLNQSGKRSGGKGVGMTVLASGGAAAVYALFDVLVQKWAGKWGAGRFLPVVMGLVGLYSIAYWPAARRRREEGSPLEFRRPLLAGATCLAIQSVLFITTIAVWGRATAANVLYSSRGLWSVLAVWLVGHWFESREQHLGARILRWRACGAALLLAAIIIVITG